jgi:hypothetical protein
MLLETLMTLTLSQAAPVAAPPSFDPGTLGPRVGEGLPSFEAADQDAKRRDFASLKGPNGLVLVLFRSADW